VMYSTPPSRRSYSIPHWMMLIIMGCVYVPIVFGWFVILAGTAIAIGILALAVVIPALLHLLRWRQ
jgi:hypothetical protein